MAGGPPSSMLRTAAHLSMTGPAGRAGVYPGRVHPVAVHLGLLSSVYLVDLGPRTAVLGPRSTGLGPRSRPRSRPQSYIQLDTSYLGLHSV